MKTRNIVMAVVVALIFVVGGGSVPDCEACGPWCEMCDGSGEVCEEHGLGAVEILGCPNCEGTGWPCP